MAERVEAYADRAIAVLVELAEQKDGDAMTRLAAANALLDRGFGRPANTTYALPAPAPRQFEFIRHTPKPDVVDVNPNKDRTDCLEG
jgi:hypothetical protein